MRRFPPRDLPPERRERRELPRPEGPFDRLLRRRPERDPAPFIIGGTIAFLALVIVLVFVVSSLLSGGNGDEGQTVVDLPGIKGTLADIPGLPPGLEAVSQFVQFQTEAPVPATIGLPLSESQRDPTSLGFYTFLNRRWQKLADVRLSQDGSLGEADFTPVPANLAILRVVAGAYVAAGSLPAQTSLHPEAKVSILSPRDYKPTSDGSIEGAATDVQPGQGVQLVPTIVGSTDDTSFIVDGILSDEALSARHVQSIVALAGQADFDGVDLEYSAVDSSLRSAFTEFVTTLADALHQSNKSLVLTLPPQTGSRQPYDWAALGQVADIIRVLPIADPVDYWDQMPDALNKIVEDVDPSKLLLVVSPFSVERTGGVTRPIGYLEAASLAAEARVRSPEDPEEILPGVTVNLVAANLDAAEGASTLRWSDDAAAVTFSLGSGQGRTIFFENEFSIAFKLEVVQAYALGGVSVLDASAQSDVANVWPAINTLLETASLPLRRPNDDSLLPRWQAEDGGDLGAGAGTAATWIAPSEPGTYTVLLIVSDGERRFGRKTTLQVGEQTLPSPTTLITFPPEEPTETPTATPSETEPPPLGFSIQVLKVAEGDDEDGEFSSNEQTSPGSTVTYFVTVDNDSPVPVTIISLQDDPHGDAFDLAGDCVTLLSQVLAEDDGDGAGFPDGGPDEVVCTFTALAPNSSGTQIVDTVVVVVEDPDGNTASGQGSATVTTP